MSQNKNTAIPSSTVTRDLRQLDLGTGNIYESIVVIAKRANQITVDVKEDLNGKLAEFATTRDNLEEVFENREQIEISKHYELMPKPTLVAINEFLEDKIYFRNPAKEQEERSPMSLKGKNIAIGVCGGIAAYKIASLVRLLIKENANVQVLMTPDAKEFITPLTLATLSKRPVLSDYINRHTETWNNHVDLGLNADLLLIAPATANTLSKMAHGACDNLLLATYLSAKCPVMFAPAMDLDMW